MCRSNDRLILTSNGSEVNKPIIGALRSPICAALAVPVVGRECCGVIIPLQSGVQAAVIDVDCDGDVDIVDIQLVTTLWGAAQGDPLYHPRYDLDGDGAIGVLDVVLAATSRQ